MSFACRLFTLFQLFCGMVGIRKYIFIYNPFIANCSCTKASYSQKKKQRISAEIMRACGISKLLLLQAKPTIKTISFPWHDFCHFTYNCARGILRSCGILKLLLLQAKLTMKAISLSWDDCHFTYNDAREVKRREEKAIDLNEERLALYPV